MITPAGIDALLKFLPYFQNRRSRFGSPAECERGAVSCSVLSSRAQRFYKACYRHHFVQEFDWGTWLDAAKKLHESPEELAKADLESIGRLVTFHIRYDRFCEGHLLEMMESGHIGQILARLQCLREKCTTAALR